MTSFKKQAEGHKAKHYREGTVTEIGAIPSPIEGKIEKEMVSTVKHCGDQIRRGSKKTPGFSH